MINDIIKRAEYLIRQCDTRDPFRIAREIGVQIEFDDLGHLKGMYNVIKRNRFAVINSNLNTYLQKLVCAHELGHDQFHRQLARDTWLQEFMIYNMKTRPEYEANIFAAELLLPDDDILEMVEMDYDFDQISRAMYSDINLVGIKIGTLVKKGHPLRGYEFRDNFLK
jgi:Zn-dependent peptidase ImmA (M78 family)